jgi:hypothetical protein
MQAARALLLAFERVPFRWKDHAHGNKQKKMTLEAGVSAPLLSNAFCSVPIIGTQPGVHWLVSKSKKEIPYKISSRKGK